VPRSEHRYLFKLYARRVIELATVEAQLEERCGHISHRTLVGTYQKRAR